MRKILLFLLILLVILPYTVNSQNEQSGIDCSYYYTIAYDTLKMYTINSTKALLMAEELANKTLPEPIEKYHKKYYNDIIQLIQIKVKYRRGLISSQQALETLSKLYLQLQVDYVKYSQRLALCVHDPQVAATLGAKTRILIKYRILPDISRTIYDIVYSKSSKNIKIIIGKESYKPGENATILIISKEKIKLNNVEIVEWPSLRLLNESQPPSNQSATNYTIKIKMPYAYQLSNPVAFSEFTKNIVKSFAIIVTYKNSTSKETEYGFRILNVTYKVPKLVISAPSSVGPWSVFTVEIRSDGYYPNSTFLINGQLISEIDLIKGSNNITINISRINVTKPVILLQVVVPPGQDYLGVAVEKPILYAMDRIPVGIESPDIVFTWLGWISIKTYKNTTTQAIMRANVGPLTLFTKNIENGTASFFATVLPITPIHLTVEAQANGHILSYSKNIIVINPTYLTILSLLIVILIFPRSLDRISIITITRRQEILGGLASGIADRAYVVESKIAQLYYQSILLLKTRLPYPQETLREHFRALKLPERLKGSLWRLLRLAERDLYSKDKPHYRDAERAFKEVVRNARK